MAKKWAEVSGTPEFKAMSPDDQETARGQYFDQVIAPQVGPDQMSDARSAFDSDTKPKKTSGKFAQTVQDTARVILGTPKDAKGFIGDTIKATNASLKGSAAALGQMLEKPLASGVNAVADAAGYNPVMTGQAFTGLGQRAEAERPNNPVANIAGDTASLAIPMKAAGKFAEAANAIPRILKAGTLGGVTSMATRPVTDESKDFATEKLKQGGEGAAFSGGLAAGGETLAGLKDFGKRVVFGIQSDGAKGLWDKAKQLGFSIRPEQSRADSARVSQSGLSDADKLQNADAGARLVSEQTGNPTRRLTPQWFDDTFKSLGAKFEQVYAPGTRLKIDKAAIDELKATVSEQQAMGSPFMSRKALAAANRMITEYETQAASSGVGKIRSVNLPAEYIQDLRSNLRQSAEMTGDRIQAGAMHDTIKAIDDSVARNHPALAAILKDASPKYRAALTLEYGRKHGFVDKEGSVSLEGLGDYLKSTDGGYTRGTSSHPLAEAGQLGEALGIRSLGQSSVAGSRWSGSGDEEFSPTRAGMWRMGVQQAKRGSVTRGIHENYLKLGGGYRSEDPSPYSLAGSVISKEDTPGRRWPDGK